MTNIIQDLLKPLSEKQDLTTEQAQRAFQIIMNGGATPAQMGAFLMGLKSKGETVQEIIAGVEVLRVKALKVKVPEGTMDTCGTGGDGKGTLNISTAVAFILAANGIPVAKHGGRAVSSQAGSADVLEKLGVKIDVEPAITERCLQEAGMCFLFAPRYHLAMRHVAPIRQELALRTVFNLLGPLSNPARPTLQLLGVYNREWLEPMAQVLHKIGVSRAWVVHGSDGLDELTLAGESYVAELKEGEVTTFTVHPKDAGLEFASTDSITGGDAEYNANRLREVLMGEKNIYRNAVVFNAAAGLLIAGKAADLKQGAELASETLSSGETYRVLQKLIDCTHRAA